MTLPVSRMKRAALSPKKTISSQETATFEKQSRHGEFLVRTERTLIKKICKVCSTRNHGSAQESATDLLSLLLLTHDAM